MDTTCMTAHSKWKKCSLAWMANHCESFLSVPKVSTLTKLFLLQSFTVCIKCVVIYIASQCKMPINVAVDMNNLKY